MVARLAATGIRRGQFLQDADRFRIATVVRELGRIVKHQHRGIYRGGKSISCTEKMTRKDLALINPCVRKEPISRFRRSPVLTSERDASTDLLGKLPQQGAEPLSMPEILKLAARHLAFQPTPDLLISRLHARSPSDSHRN
jgi:hypothetical protein